MLPDLVMRHAVNGPSETEVDRRVVGEVDRLRLFAERRLRLDPGRRTVGGAARSVIPSRVGQVVEATVWRVKSRYTNRICSYLSVFGSEILSSKLVYALRKEQKYNRRIDFPRASVMLNSVNVRTWFGSTKLHSYHQQCLVASDKSSG